MDIANIVFTGVCAFILNTPGVQPKVLFPQGSGWPNDLERHQAYVVVNTDLFDVYDFPAPTSYGRKHETGKIESTLGKHFTYFVLDFEALRVVNADPNQHLALSMVKLQPGEKLTPYNQESLDWVPKLREVWPHWWWFGTHTAHAECIKTPDPHYVASEMLLEHGFLSSTFVSPIEWRFGPRPIPHHMVRQALAQEVTLNIELTSPFFLHFLLIEAIDLHSPPYDPHVIGYLLLTRKNNHNYNEPFRILVANVPEADIVPDDSPTFALKNPPLTDPHFKLYYHGVFASSPMLPPIPRRNGDELAVVPFPTLLRVGGTNCPPAMYAEVLP